MACADVIIIKAKSIELQIMTLVLIKMSKQISLTINKDKTKFMIQSLKNLPTQHNLRVEKNNSNNLNT